MISKKLNGRFLSCDIFILHYRKSHAGRPVHQKNNLASPYKKVTGLLSDDNFRTEVEYIRFYPF